MTVHKMSGSVDAIQGGRYMKEVPATELESALAELLHSKTGHRYIVSLDAMSFSKDPQEYDSGQLSMRFKQDVSRERSEAQDSLESTINDLTE